MMKLQSCDASMARAPIPATRDPFINTPLTRLPPANDGLERFWISTWNSLEGALGVVVNEVGEHRIYRTNNWRTPGFYSAAPAGPEAPDSLWLCGMLNVVVHLDITSGEFSSYETGAPQALVFAGMPLDPATGKLLAFAYPPPRHIAFTFDIRRREPVRVLEAPTIGHYMRSSFPNGDGTWSIVLHLPGLRLLVWDPQTDALEEVVIAEAEAEAGAAAATAQSGTTYHVIQDEQHRVYLPHLGWYDPQQRAIGAVEPRPEREMTWFGQRDGYAFGINVENATASVARWNLSDGVVQQLATIPDCNLQNVNLTSSGKIIAVNLYGQFFRFDATTGALECTRRLATDAIGAVDCVCRIGAERVLGTPFITQRFWETNLKTKQAVDCGRAAPGFGEIMRLVKVGKMVYMAAYTGGELVEYDPAQPSRFPENPHVVADPPGGMRPVAICTDGRSIFYACSREYGHLGATLTRYDTRTGLVFNVLNPLPDQQIQSLCLDNSNRRLLAGTTYHADCQSCPPATDICYLAALDPLTLLPSRTWPAPQGAVAAHILGPLGQGRWLVRCVGALTGGLTDATVSFDPRRDDQPAAEALQPVPGSEALQPVPEGGRDIVYSGRAAIFLLLFNERVELWNMKRHQRLSVLYEGSEWIQRVEVEEKSVLIVLLREVLLLEDCLLEDCWRDI